MTHVHVSACALHADRVHEDKAAKSSCVLTCLRSQHARLKGQRASKTTARETLTDPNYDEQSDEGEVVADGV